MSHFKKGEAVIVRSKGGNKMYFIIIIAIIIAILLYCIKTADIAYEDETGFHYGEEKKGGNDAT